MGRVRVKRNTKAANGCVQRLSGRHGVGYLLGPYIQQPRHSDSVLSVYGFERNRDLFGGQGGSDQSTHGVEPATAGAVKYRTTFSPSSRVAP